MKKIKKKSLYDPLFAEFSGHRYSFLSRSHYTPLSENFYSKNHCKLNSAPLPELNGTKCS